MTPELAHYQAVKDELETRIDAIGTIFAALGGFEGDDLLQLVADALRHLGVDHVELQIGIEKAGSSARAPAHTRHIGGGTGRLLRLDQHLRRLPSADSPY